MPRPVDNTRNEHGRRTPVGKRRGCEGEQGRRGEYRRGKADAWDDRREPRAKSGSKTPAAAARMAEPEEKRATYNG